jgi:branched-chain amino acid transport system permease protein
VAVRARQAGRTLKAIRDSEIAAASSGISLARYKTLAFALSAFYAGVAGSLYAIARGFMNPDIFPIVLSVYLVAALALGGVDSFVGLILGAGAIYVLQNRAGDVTQWLNHLPHVNLNPQRPGMPDVIFGAVLIVVLIIPADGRGRCLTQALWPANKSLVQ